MHCEGTQLISVIIISSNMWVLHIGYGMSVASFSWVDELVE